MSTAQVIWNDAEAINDALHEMGGLEFALRLTLEPHMARLSIQEQCAINAVISAISHRRMAAEGLTARLTRNIDRT